MTFLLPYGTILRKENNFYCRGYTVPRRKGLSASAMKKISLILALVMIFTCVFVSCGKEKESGGLSVTTGGEQSTSDTRLVTGLDGKNLTLPKTVSSVVSLSPAASIIINSIGASDKIKAADSVSAEYVTVSSTTDASGSAALAPDAIFVDEADASSIGDTTVPVFVIPQAQSVADINNLIRLCGKVLGINVDDIVTRVTNVMNVAQMNSASYSITHTVYIDFGDETVGNGTFISEMLHASGLENIASMDGFGTMTDEEIAAANPEFIFTSGDVSAVLSNPALADTDAVKNEKVYSFNKADLRYGTNNIVNVMSIFTDAVSTVLGDK